MITTTRYAIRWKLHFQKVTEYYDDETIAREREDELNGDGHKTDFATITTVTETRYPTAECPHTRR